MIQDLNLQDLQHNGFLPNLHIEVLQIIEVSTEDLERQSPLAWKYLINARLIELKSLPAFVTRHRRHDFYDRHSEIIEDLLLAYSKKLPSHIQYVIQSSAQITSKLQAIFPIVLYEATIHYYASGEEAPCIHH